MKFILWINKDIDKLLFYREMAINLEDLKIEVYLTINNKASL